VSQQWRFCAAICGILTTRLTVLVALAWIRREIFGEFVGFFGERVSVRRGRLLGRDIRPGLGILPIDLEPALKVGLGIRLDGVNRAFGLANSAIDALVGMNDEHILALVEAVYRADLHAIGILAFDTNFRDDVSHRSHMTLPGQPTGNPTLLESFETGRRGPCLSQSSALHKDSHPRRLPHRAKGLA